MLSLLAHARRTTAIGMDLGESAVRAVQLCSAGEVFTLTRWRADPRPQPDDTLHHRDRVDQVRSWLRKSGFRGSTSVVGIAPPDVQFHALELPEVKTSELQQIIRFEVERLMTERGSSVETSYWTLPATKVAAPNAIGVAASSPHVTEIVAWCAEVGLTCACVDTTPTALCRFANLLHRWRADEVWGVLDLSARHARLLLAMDQVPVLVRTVGSGGRAWTERIAAGLKISAATAEVHKCMQGITLAVRGMSEAVVRSPAAEVASLVLGVLRSDLHSLATEVKRSYEYVLSCYPNRRASDLVLVGGGAAMPNLPEFLAHVLGIPVRRATSYLGGDTCRLRFPDAAAGGLETLACGIGLALTE